MRLQDTNDLAKLKIDLIECRKNRESVVLEDGFDKDTLIRLNEALIDVGDIKIVLIVDLAQKTQSKKIENLDILSHLKNIKHLAIMSNSSERLDDLTELRELNSLRSFSLNGNYKSGISLKPIENHIGIEQLYLDSGMNKAQHAFANKLENLRHLRVANLDASLIEKKPYLEKVQVDKSLKSEEKLQSLAPNIKHLKLSQSKNIQSFDWLESMGPIESLSICYNPNLKDVPRIEAAFPTLNNFECLDCKNLDNVKALQSCQALTNLSITNISNLKVADFDEVFQLSSLRCVYLDFNSAKEQSKYLAIAEENCWETNNKAWNVHYRLD